MKTAPLFASLLLAAVVAESRPDGRRQRPGGGRGRGPPDGLIAALIDAEAVVEWFVKDGKFGDDDGVCADNVPFELDDLDIEESEDADRRRRKGPPPFLREARQEACDSVRKDDGYSGQVGSDNPEYSPEEDRNPKESTDAPDYSDLDVRNDDLGEHHELGRGGVMCEKCAKDKGAECIQDGDEHYFCVCPEGFVGDPHHECKQEEDHYRICLCARVVGQYGLETPFALTCGTCETQRDEFVLTPDSHRDDRRQMEDIIDNIVDTLEIGDDEDESDEDDGDSYEDESDESEEDDEDSDSEED